LRFEIPNCHSRLSAQSAVTMEHDEATLIWGDRASRPVSLQRL
jgi:hypothetical protein